jgi:catechol 2,3-dioxygenase-like lactoylglutathione lyase family enzyme
MPAALQHIDALSLFVEDVAAAKSFYTRVFGVGVVFEDAACAVVKFDNLLVNLLHVDSAQEIVAPAIVGGAGGGPRFQLSVFVPDVDAVCEALKANGVAILAGPLDRPWGMRTANFVDPAGHSWEVAQRLDELA